MRSLLTTVAIMGLALAAPATAAVQFNVGIGAPVAAIPGNNDFQTQLAAAGLSAYTATGSSISLTGKATLTFEFMGSESGFSDTFTAAGGTLTKTENSAFTAWGSQLIGSADYNAGAISDWFFSSSGNPGPFGIGSSEMAIFIPTGTQGNYLSNVIYLGFDDQINNADDNHDDFIVRITAVDFVDPGGIPEPSSWAMLITGFGLVGAARRRRNQAVTVSA